MADGKQCVNHPKDLLPTFLVSKKMKWNSEKPHTQIEMPPKFQPVRFCETRISSYSTTKPVGQLFCNNVLECDRVSNIRVLS